MGTTSREPALSARRRELLEQVSRIEGELIALRSLRAGEHDDDEHDPDGAPASAEWSRLEGLLVSRRASLATLAEAESREAAGLGSVCRDCGAPIPLGRLEARPESVTCVRCAS